MTRSTSRADGNAVLRHESMVARYQNCFLVSRERGWLYGIAVASEFTRVIAACPVLPQNCAFHVPCWPFLPVSEPSLSVISDSPDFHSSFQRISASTSGICIRPLTDRQRSRANQFCRLGGAGTLTRMAFERLQCVTSRT